MDNWSAVALFDQSSRLLAMLNDEFFNFCPYLFMTYDQTGFDVSKAQLDFLIEPFAVFVRLAWCLAGGFHDVLPLVATAFSINKKQWAHHQRMA